MAKGKNQDKGIRMKSQVKMAYLPLFFFFLFSFSFGRLFEIFAWNTNVIRIESRSQFSNSDEAVSYSYSQLNDQYWEKKNLEEAKIRIDFSDRYEYLDEE